MPSFRAPRVAARPGAGAEDIATNRRHAPTSASGRLGRVTAVAGALALTLSVAVPAATFAGSLTTEAQDWWDGPVGGGESSNIGHPGRHTHLEITVPTGKVNGVQEVKWKVVHHRNTAGKLIRVKWQDDDGSDRGKTELVKKYNVELTPGKVVKGTFKIDTRHEKEGWRVWRFYAYVQHDNGNIQVARPVVSVYVDNGSGKDRNSGSTWIKHSGWYKEKGSTDWGYLNTQVKRTDLTSAPIKGKWSPKIKIDLNGGKGSPKISGWSVHVDPAFHQKDNGKVIKTGTGAWKGNVTIDTSKLSKGKHRLVIRAKQDDGKKHHEAVGVFPFEVK